ncbi:MAG: SGNH/GDSL hydrolase family protein [Sedimentisphaerales bacterium]|nr:SGNH/GDSL hydrolase family protein [Sedimentisphaerales bacterium]
MSAKIIKPRTFVKILFAFTLILPLVFYSTLSAETAEPAPDDNLTWFNVEDWGLEGKPFPQTERFFDRLPAKAKNIVRPPVWSLSQHSAGMCVFFKSDAPEIHARWHLLSPNLAMDHMPATGVSGLDLYARDDQGRWRWLAIGRPTQQKMQSKLVSGIESTLRDYMIYLPLYNGLELLEIGVPKNTQFVPVPPRKQKPILFYGTSITQGGCASRPGMCHSAILQRRLNRPVINLGFSGNGKMEKEVAQLLAELDPCVYVIDCLPNMNAQLVTERTEPLVKIIRQARPDTPIVLVEDRTYSNAAFFPAKQKHHAANRAALRQAYENLLAAGFKNLHYVEGQNLLGSDGSGTVDGSHPTDLGFVRMADALEAVLKPILKK